MSQTYEKSGVSLEAGYESVRRIKKHIDLSSISFVKKLLPILSLIIVFASVANAQQTQYQVTFEVIVQEAGISYPISNAIIIIGDTLITDEFGKAYFLAENGYYEYTLSKEEYPEITGSFVVNDDSLIVVIVLFKPDNINENRFFTIDLFPNPTSSELHITNYELQIMEVEIFNMYGRKCNIPHIIGNEINISLAHLQAGIYFIRIITEHGITTKKIIKY